MQPAGPVAMDEEHTSCLRRTFNRCVPKSALGTSKMACVVSAFAMLLGMGLLLASLELQKKTTSSGSQDNNNAFQPHTLNQSSMQALNEEWLALKTLLVANTSVVLPQSPSAKALMWLATLQQQQANNPQSRSSPLPLEERYALATLFYHWEGADWNMPQDKVGWDFNLFSPDNRNNSVAAHHNECEWFGVDCSPSLSDGAMMTVTKLNMTGGTHFFLRGSVPTELGLLSNMEIFIASDNRLQGSLPNDLSAWTNLREIHLRFNQLTGLGQAYKSWKKMQVLDIGENRMLGNLSSHALRQMNQLEELVVQNNRDLYTDAPLFIAPASSNSISSPYWPHLKQLSIFLTHVELDLTHFSNQNFPSLERLDAAQVAMPSAHSIPSSIGSMTNLNFINLMNPIAGRLTGVIPTEIGLLSNKLTFLSLDGSGIGGPLPSEMGLLTQLEILSVFMTSINGTIPSFMGNMQSLEVLDVSDTQLSGTIPTELGLCSNLYEMQFQFTRLAGSVPEEVCQLRESTTQGMFKLTSGCAVSSNTASERQIVCECCTDCFGA